MPPSKRSLVETAMAIAESLVETALAQLLGDAQRAGDGHTVSAIDTIRPPLALPPAPRRGRKPGPKPRRVKAQGSGLKAQGSAPVMVGGVDLATRYCRKCHKRGLAIRVPGSDKAVRCGGCGFRWNVRVKAAEGGGRATPAGRAVKDRPVSAEDICGRCNHHLDLHDGAGPCLVSRCGCEEFYQ